MAGAGGHFALSLVLSSLCGPEAFKESVAYFNEHVLVQGTPFCTVAALLSGERHLVSSSLWGGDKVLRRGWKRHLAAVLNCRTSGWERFGMSLGDQLQELGEIEASHFCYAVSGCPPASPAQPGARFTLLGCVMNSTSLNLLSEDAVIGFALTEAFEWAKYEGDKNAGIDALRPFKAAYAMLLTDLGMNETALKYINYVLQSTFSTKVDADSTKEVPPLALSLSTASGDQSFFLSWLRRLHARLESLLKKQQIDFCSSHLNEAVRSDSLPERVGSFGDLTYQAETDSDPMKKPFFYAGLPIFGRKGNTKSQKVRSKNSSPNTQKVSIPMRFALR